jgi:hypothetical protein
VCVWGGGLEWQLSSSKRHAAAVSAVHYIMQQHLDPPVSRSRVVWVLGRAQGLYEGGQGLGWGNS